MSDRENLETQPATAGFVEEARARGGGAELMPAAAAEAPITASRFLSLATKVRRQRSKTQKRGRRPLRARQDRWRGLGVGCWSSGHAPGHARVHLGGVPFCTTREGL